MSLFLQPLPQADGELHLKTVPPSCCNPLGCDGDTNGSASSVPMGCSAGMEVSAGPLMPLPQGLAPPGGPGCLPLLKVRSNTRCPLNLCDENTSGSKTSLFSQTLIYLFSSVLPSNPGKQTTCIQERKVPLQVMCPI